MGIVATGWLSALPFLISAPIMLLVSLRSDRAGQRTPYIWPLLAVSGLALLGSFFAGPQHFWAAYALLLVAAVGFYAPYGPYFAMIPELLPSNVSGGSTALINSFGAVGAFLGIYLVGYLNRVTGSPSTSFVLMGVCLLASGLMMAAFPRIGKRPTAAARASAVPQESA